MKPIEKLLSRIDETYEMGNELPRFNDAWTQELIATMGEWRAAKAEYAALKKRELCAGCGSDRIAAVLAVIRGKAACCPDCTQAFPLEGKTRCPECTARYHHSRNCTRR